MDSSILEKIGLTRSESAIYISLLRFGTLKAGEILKRTGINSGKIYEILEGLKTKGLASESVTNNVRHFTAAPPPQILEIIEKKKLRFEKEEQAINAVLPELEKLRNSGVKETKALNYTGFKGLKTAAEEALASLNAGEEVLAMGIIQRKDKKINEFWLKFAQKRIKKKIFGRHIFSEKGEHFQALKKMRLTKARFLPNLTPAAIDVFGKDKVLIINHAEPPTCILIYDENAATSFKNFFEQLWKLAKA